MSERMKQALATVRDAQAFKWPFSELLVAIEALDEEVDALRARVASLEPVPFENARDAEAHEAAVAKLTGKGFEWEQQKGGAYAIASDRCLTSTSAPHGRWRWRMRCARF